MDWKDIAGAVAKSAPILGALLSATPAGAVISAAGALIGSALGVEATPDAIGAQIAANPEALVKLREIEANRAVELQRLLVESERNRIAADTAEIQAAALDRADARQMQIATHSMTPALLSFLITFGFFGVLGFMLGSSWKPTDNPTLLLLVGSLSASWGAVVAYHFGTSAGSARKDVLFAERRRTERE